MSPCGAAPHLGPQGLDGVEGWATGPPGPGHLQLQQTYWSQQFRHRPHGASGRLQRALQGQQPQIEVWSLYSILQIKKVSLPSLYQSCVTLSLRTYSCQRGPF